MNILANSETIFFFFFKSNEYDDINKEGIRSIFSAGVALMVSAAQVYRIEFLVNSKKLWCRPVV